ncbi:proliferation marker protein Ki-67 [Sorex fumeus]|uniref:proliferation marker protein Ki-67 n=1 Tax=Sorex fumeus TaxID=62283 RepID=UPI0024AE21BE|nr:proliferation marker protein Ki-67 [Sorex fumeus]
MGPSGRLVTIRRSGLDGAHFPLTLSSCLFGRDIECDIRIQLPVVSKQHCKIEIHQKEATLINFSSSNPTQLNGRAIAQPVRLQHGDVITIVDRSFRYEDASHQSHQDGDRPAASVGRRHSQESLRPLSVSGFSSDHDGEVPDSEVLEEKVPGRSGVRAKSLGGARRSLESHAGRRTPELAGERGRPPGTPRPEKGRTSLSPFQQLYESMKEELGGRAEKENVPGAPRGRSASLGPQGQPPAPGSGGPRRKSTGGSQRQAVPAPAEQGHTPKERQGPGAHPVSCPRPGTPVAKSPGQPAPSPRPSSRKRRRSEALGADAGMGSPSPGPQKLPRKSQTPTKVEGACVPGDTPEKPLPKKQRRLSSSGAQSPSVLAPLLMQGLGETPQVPRAEKAAGHAGPGSPGLGSTHVGSCKDPAKWAAGEQGKRRRVSFGGRLRPELFDENLPPNTPLKRGETPRRCRSLAPSVLKTIIKGRPQSPAQGVPPSDPRQEAADSPRQPVPVVDTPKRTSRRSGQQPPRRVSLGRSRQGILQMIHSKRRSGASEANLMVARSWADVVRLGAKKTQTRTAKHAPIRQPPRKQRRIQNTPKKPVGSIPDHFSTGHANSPCTITVGRAHLEKVREPARPQWMLNHLVSSHKAGFPEDLSAEAAQGVQETPMIGKSPRTPRTVTPMCRGPASDAGKLRLLQKTPEQNLGPAEGVSGSRRKSGTPRVKAQPLEDLPSLEELFQTPKQVNAIATSEDGPCSSAKPEPAGTPTPSRRLKIPSRGVGETPAARTTPHKPVRAATTRGEPAGLEGVTGPQETAGQDLGLAGGVTGSRRRSKTPTVKAQPLEDLPSLEELFRTPKQVKEAKSEDGPCSSAKPEPAGTPITSRRLKTPSRGMQEPSAARTTPHTPGRATPTCRGPASDAGKLRLLQKTPEQDLGPAEGVSGSRRKSGTTGGKVQPLEDLPSLEELFRTPKQVKEAKSEDGPCSSAKPEPAGTPAASRRLKTPSRVVQEPSAARTTPHTPGRATPMCRGPASDAGKLRFLQKTPEQDLGPAEGVSGSRRKSGTPRVKAQSHEDLPSLEELFRTPKQVKAIAKSEDGPCSSAKTEPAGTSSTNKRLKTLSRGVQEPSAARSAPHTPGRAVPTGGEPAGLEGVMGPQKAAGQDLGPATGITGSRRRSRTPRVKAQPLEDLPSLEELFRTPEQVKAATSEDGPCSSAKPEPSGTPTASRRLKTPSRGMQEPSAARTTPHTPGRATPMCRGPASDTGKLRFLQETPKQDLGPAEGVSGSRRKPGTPRVKVQSHEDLPSLEELFRTPKQVSAIATSENGPCSSAKPEPAGTPTASRRLKTPSRGVQEPSAARSAPHTPGRAAPTHGELAGLEGVMGPQEAAGQDLGPAAGITGNRRRSRTPRVKAQPLEDLASLEELFRTPEQVKAATSVNGPCSSAKPEPAGTPITSRRLKTPSRGMQEPSTARTTPHTPGRATPTCRGPASDAGKLRLLQKTPEQDLGPAEGVSGSRRKPGTPRVKVQSHEDLPSLEELFRTPKQVKAIATSEDGPCLSAKPEPAGTSSTNKRLKTPSRGVQEPSAARSAPHTPGRAAPTHGEPAGLEGVTGSQEAAGQDLSPAAGITGNRRRSRTPRVKAQPLEDLAGLEELFRTPEHVKTATSEDGPCLSAKPEPTGTPSTSRRVKTPSQEVGEPLAARTTPHTPGRAASIHTGPASATGKVTFLQETPEQGLSRAEAVGRSRRKPGTPRVKAQPLEDLVGLRELFRSPEQAQEPMSAVNVAEDPHEAPQPESVVSSRVRRPRAAAGPEHPGEELPTRRRAPRTGPTTAAGAEGTEPPKEAPKQRLEPTEKLTTTRSGRQPRAAQVKVEAPEGSAELREPPQPEGHTQESVSAAKTPRVPRAELPAKPTVVTTRTRRVQAPAGPTSGAVEPPAGRRPTRAATGRATRLDQADGKGGAAPSQGPAEQKPQPAEGVAGSTRQPRAARAKVEAPGGPAGPREPPQPQNTDEPVSAAKTPGVPRAEPPAKPTVVTMRTRRVQAPAGPTPGAVEPPAGRRPTRAATGRATRLDQADGEEGATADPGPAGQKPQPAEGAAGGRRQLRAARVKVEAPEVPAEQREPPQPQNTDEPVSAAKTPRVARADPPAKPTVVTTRTRRVQAPVGPEHGDVEPPAGRRPTRAATGRAARSDQADGEGSAKAPQELAGQKPQPAEGAAGSRRQLRAARAKAEAPEVLAESTEPPSPHEDASVLSPEGRPSEAPLSAPQADSASPGNKRRRLRAAAGTAGSEEAPTRPRASRAVRGAAKDPGDAAATSSQGATEQKPDLGDPVSRSRRPLRAQAGSPGEEAQPRVHLQLSQLAGVQAPEQTALSTRRRPARTPRSGPQGPLGAPVEEPESSGDPGASPSQGPALPAPPAGRVTRGKRQRPEPAAEEPPVQKKQRVAPPDPPITAQSQRVRARRTEPAEEQPDSTKQEQADGTRAGRAGTTRQTIGACFLMPKIVGVLFSVPKTVGAHFPVPKTVGARFLVPKTIDALFPLPKTVGARFPLPKTVGARFPVPKTVGARFPVPKTENDDVDAKKLRLRSRRERAAV